MSSNKLIKKIIPVIVKVRKYEVDVENLKILLRNSKKKIDISNRTISEKLNKPLTLVEHWFRNDNCFSIPDEDCWYELKEILGITDNSFDLSVTEFEEREGTYEKGNRVYDSSGICPTLTSEGAELERIIVYKNN